MASAEAPAPQAEATAPAKIKRSGKFTISIEEVVNLGNYESLRIGLAEELDKSAEKPEDAYARILQKVNDWTTELRHSKQVASARQAPKPVSPVPSSPAPIVSEDPYAGPFEARSKQSVNKKNLRSMRVDPEALADPKLAELYERVKEWKKLQVGNVRYSYWTSQDGAEFIGQWRKLPLG